MNNKYPHPSGGISAERYCGGEQDNVELLWNMNYQKLSINFTTN